jgi:hypothetical protein
MYHRPHLLDVPNSELRTLNLEPNPCRLRALRYGAPRHSLGVGRNTNRAPPFDFAQGGLSLSKAKK